MLRDGQKNRQTNEKMDKQTDRETDDGRKVIKKS